MNNSISLQAARTNDMWLRDGLFMRENSQCVELRFEEGGAGVYSRSSVYVYHLDPVTAEGLHVFSRMTVPQRGRALHAMRDILKRRESAE